MLVALAVAIDGTVSRVDGALLAYVAAGPDRPLTRREGAYLVVAYLVFVSGRILLYPGQ